MLTMRGHKENVHGKSPEQVRSNFRENKHCNITYMYIRSCLVDIGMDYEASGVDLATSGALDVLAVVVHANQV